MRLGQAGFLFTAQGAQGPGQHLPAFGRVAQAHALSGQQLGHGRILVAVQIQAGQQEHGRGIERIAQQGIVQQFAGLAAMLLGAGLGKITLNLKGDYFCIATLGVGEAIRLIFNNLQLTINVGGKDFLLDGAKGVASIPLKTTLFGDWNALSNGDVGTFLSTLFSSALFIVIIFLTATALLMNSKHGRSMLAVREDELAAQMSGINTFRSKMLAMCMSALYAGIAGGMMAHYFGYLQPKMFLMTKSTEYTIMVIFGGMGSITGSVLGTVLLCALPELLRAVGDWRLVMYGLAVIVIMIVRPKGLMGGKELPVGRICRAVGRVFTKKKKDLPPPDGGSVGEEASV